MSDRNPLRETSSEPAVGGPPEDGLEPAPAREQTVPGRSAFFGRVFFAALPAMAAARCGHPDLIVKGAWEIAEQAERRAKKAVTDSEAVR